MRKIANEKLCDGAGYMEPAAAILHAEILCIITGPPRFNIALKFYAYVNPAWSRVTLRPHIP